MYIRTVSVHPQSSVHYVYNDTGWALSFVELQFYKKEEEDIFQNLMKKTFIEHLNIYKTIT